MGFFEQARRDTLAAGFSAIRFWLFTAAKTADEGKHKEIGEFVLDDIGKMIRIARDTHDAALLATARHFARTFFTISCQGPELADRMIDRLAGEDPDPLATWCSYCGRKWEPEQAWKVFFFDATWLAGQWYTACSDACCTALEKAEMPGYASFTSNAGIDRFNKARHAPTEAPRAMAGTESVAAILGLPRPS